MPAELRLELPRLLWLRAWLDPLKLLKGLWREELPVPGRALGEDRLPLVLPGDGRCAAEGLRLGSWLAEV